MLKVLFCTVGLSLFFLGCTKPTNQPSDTVKQTSSPAEAQSDTTVVEVTFNGLMVFEKSKNDNDYEVGVIPEKIGDFVTNHRFRVVSESGEQIDLTNQIMASGSPVVLEVVTEAGQTAPVDISERHKKDCNRQADTGPIEDLEHAFDFCWIMDLEKDFHNGMPLTLNPNSFRPVIKLRNGELFVKYKYDELEKLLPSEGGQTGQKQPLGFVAETIGLRVLLRRGDQLALKVDGQTRFQLGNGHDKQLQFYNEPINHSPGAPSHFPYYYHLFQGLTPNDKVDIAVKEYELNGKAYNLHPVNRWPNDEHRSFAFDLHEKTFDDEACGGVFLGMSGDGLGSPAPTPAPKSN